MLARLAWLPFPLPPPATFGIAAPVVGSDEIEPQARVRAWLVVTCAEQIKSHEGPRQWGCLAEPHPQPSTRTPTKASQRTVPRTCNARRCTRRIVATVQRVDELCGRRRWRRLHHLHRRVCVAHVGGRRGGWRLPLLQVHVAPRDSVVAQHALTDGASVLPPHLGEEMSHKWILFVTESSRSESEGNPNLSPNLSPNPNPNPNPP